MNYRQLVRRAPVLAGFFGLLLAACGGGGGGSDQPAPPPPPTVQSDYFPAAVGDRWTYQSAEDGESHVRVMESTTAEGRPHVRLRTLDSDGSSDALLELGRSSVTSIAGPGADPITRALGRVLLLQLPVVKGNSYRVIDKVIANELDVDGDGRPDHLHVVGESRVLDVLGSLTIALGSFDNVAWVQTQVVQTLTLSRDGRKMEIKITVDEWFGAQIGLLRRVTQTLAQGVTERSEELLSHYRVGDRRSGGEPAKPIERLPKPGSAGREALIQLSVDKDLDPLALRPDSLRVSNSDGVQIAGNTVVIGKRSLQFVPAQTLPNGRYEVAVGAGLEDYAGRALQAGESWTFTLDSEAPVVTAIEPAKDAVDVPLAAVMRVRFNEAIDPGSATAGIWLEDSFQWGRVPVTLSLVDDMTVLLVPQQPLKPRWQYALMVAGVADKAGNFHVGRAEYKFRTDPGQFGRGATLPGWAGVVAQPNTVVLGDFNGDGRQDLVYEDLDDWTIHGKTRLRLLLQQGDGSLKEAWRHDDNRRCLSRLLARDLSGTGRAELVRVGACGLQHWRMAVDGAMQQAASSLKGAIMADPENLQSLGAGKAYWLRSASNAGRASLLLDAFGKQWLLEQDSSGDFVGRELPFNDFGGSRGHVADVGDINGDGLDDLLVLGGSYPDGYLSGNAFYLQTAAGSFLRQQLLALEMEHAHLIDRNGDGRLDIAYSSRLDGMRHIGFLLQQPDGALQSGTSVSTGQLDSISFRDFLVSDLNGDGRSDIVVDHSGSYSVLLQRADGQFSTAEVFYQTTDSSYSLLAGDLNGDQLVDLLFGVELVLQRRPVLQAVGVASAATAAPYAALGKAARPKAWWGRLRGSAVDVSGLR